MTTTDNDLTKEEKAFVKRFLNLFSATLLIGFAVIFIVFLTFVCTAMFDGVRRAAEEQRKKSAASVVASPAEIAIDVKQARSIRLDAVNKLLTPAQWALIDEGIRKRAEGGFGYFTSKMESTGDDTADANRITAILLHYRKLGFEVNAGDIGGIRQVTIDWQ